MQIRLTFKPTLRRQIGDGETEEEEIYPTELSSRMEGILRSTIDLSYDTEEDNPSAIVESIKVMDKGIVMTVIYTRALLDLGEWLDNISFYHGSAADGWMEGDLSVEEYPEAEFVPILIDVKIDLSVDWKKEQPAE